MSERIEYRQFVPSEEQLEVALGEFYPQVTALMADLIGGPDGAAEELLKSQAEKYSASVVIALDDDANVVGFGSLKNFPDSTRYDLSHAFVKPQFRRRGLYKELVRRRLEIARALGATAVVMQVSEDKPHVPYLREIGFSEMKGEFGQLWLEKKLSGQSNQETA